MIKIFNELNMFDDLSSLTDFCQSFQEDNMVFVVLISYKKKKKNAVFDHSNLIFSVIRVIITTNNYGRR